MTTAQSYFDDPLCLEFMAEVTEINSINGRKSSVILPSTYFYPTSGGQDHDTGKIGEAFVLDVYKAEDGRIIHVLDREIIPGIYPAHIDKMRRWQNMQAHTAQHILSRSFEIELNLETLSANINSDKPSTIDLETDDFSTIDFSKVEEKANSIVFENRNVKSYYISDSDIPQIPFRKPPKVSGKIRVVEVDGYDYSACGGTHCPTTGMLGIIKILKSEIQNKKTRVHFVAGIKALQVFQETYAVVRKLSIIQNSSVDELVNSIQRQAENMQKIRSELEIYKTRIQHSEADQLVESAIDVKDLKLITSIYSNRTAYELRNLTSRIVSRGKYVIVLGTIEEKKLSLVVGCSKDINLDARLILNLCLEKFNGRGGGDQFMAQGGCLIPNNEVCDFFEITRKYIMEEFTPG